jgi:hypothetical protein
MDLVDFLKSVTPSGPKLLMAQAIEAHKPDGTLYKSFSHTVCEDHPQLAKTALSRSDFGHDVYFALASYKQGFYKNAKGKRKVRTHENVDSLKAVWFDIDFKGEYPDPKTAILAVKAFCQTVKIDAPSFVVGSGNGLHVYWPFDHTLPVVEWQPLADSFKEAAKAIGLKADLACTADAARVLRPPGTFNYKDQANPKPVKLLYANGIEHDPATLTTALLPWRPSKRAAPAAPVTGPNSDLTGGVGSAVVRVPSTFAEVVKHCAVSKFLLDTGGKDCIEPEWVAILQLLKHCTDGDTYAHQVSQHHPKYSESACEDKWQQRLENSAGPTLCKTFELYRPDMCGKCPHNGFVKTPLQVGTGDTQDITGLPVGWRVCPNEKGIERLMLTDPANNVKEWLKVFRHIPSNFRPVKSVATGQFDMLLDIRLKGTESWTVTLPMSMLGNHRKMVETLAAYGVVLKAKEVPPFGDLMASWLEKLQNARRVADVTEQLGWFATGGQITGFGTGPSVFYSDGRVRNDVRPSREFAPLSKLYEPRGELEPWKKVAAFVAEQNNPALTAVLAASFGAPLLKFVGIQGGILSLVSTASGVGKSSVLKLSQAVWGSPVHAMNSVDDTPKSVAKKLGFLNNLPAYWDELRGKQTVDGFCNLAFQITQGREKSRLDSGANLRESQTWETMLVVASNESIFEAMARRTTGSDAGMVRTFEIEMTETPQTDSSSAEVTLMFETLSQHYGHAGKIYAQYLAQNWQEVEKMVQATYLKVAGNMESAERFWYGIIAILIVGASLARKLGLVNIDVRKLHGFLLQNVEKLKGRTTTMSQEGTLTEIFAEYLRERGDRMLVIDKFPPEHKPYGEPLSSKVRDGRGRPPASYIPEIKESPRSEKASIVVALDDKKIRFATRDFSSWLQSRELPTYGFTEKLEQQLGARKLRCVLGLGTRYAGPRVWSMEVDARSAGFASHDESLDSSTET